ncbi:MAG TPA: hypothetical protein VMR95_04335 [Candidatus Binatia bacterium]|nr:hypothetical protein [Candidatus Binatia bacterium]
MDPNNYEQPGLRLPEPLTGSETVTATKPEKTLSVSPEILLGQSSPQTSVPTNPALPVPSATAHQPVSDQPSSVPTNLPTTTDDADLIEKEWIIKAKAIVERTKDDPHQQNYEMSHFKADYLKKRYNKDIKVSSES